MSGAAAGVADRKHFRVLIHREFWGGGGHHRAQQHRVGHEDLMRPGYDRV
jgi:hypothetical protein